MSAKIKLQRVGTKNQPSYRVVVQDEARPTVARVVATLGTYQPLKEPTEFTVNKELTLDWIRKGAKPTEKVRILLGKAGVLPPIDLAALPKRKKKGEVPAEETAAPAAAAPAPAAPQAEATAA
ncbi:MAG: 30S ribosomal protein S16 [Candidatus Margulisbacteria bacterium]|jgi:small subunit ribosomal protein S16|nr:30S ribosomal protein S16 [Candidatus Margulisiibacteriota bacterium]